MISMRINKFYKRTHRKLQFDIKDPVGFDKTKVECFNCHKIRHFARECRAKWNQDSRKRDARYNGNKTRDNGRRPAYQDDSKSLVTINGEDINWSRHVEEDAQNYVMMAYSSSNLGSDNEVKSCSKACEESYARLKKLYDDQRDKLGDASVEITAYTLAFKKQYSSKNLSRLLNTQMSANDKFRLGYGDYRYGSILSYENEVLQSVFINKESDLEDTPINDRYAVGMHAVPPPMTGNYMPSRLDVEIHYSKFTYETSTSMPEPVRNASKVVYEPKVWTDAPIIEEYESDSDNDLMSNVQEDKEKSIFTFTDSVKHVKTSRENIKETGTTNHSPKIEKQDRNGHTKKGLGMLSLEKHALFVDDPHRALKDKGIVDSGCSRHMTGNKAHLADYQEFKGGSVAFGGSNGRITGKGKIKSGRFNFKDVYYVEELKHYNLFSVSQICDKKNKVLFTDTHCLMLSPDFKLSDENQVLLKIPRQHNMYSFNLKNIDPSRDLACLFAKASVDESNKCHKRLGHVNFKNLNKLVKENIVRGLPSKIFDNDHTYVACQKRKQHKASCNAKTREYNNARSQQQNGVIERKNKTLIKAARTMLADSFLATTFWAEAVNTACYVLSRVLVTKPQNKTPYELLTSKQLIISYLRPFGCHVTILNTIDQLGKFNGKSDFGFLVGYALNSKAFRVYNLKTKSVKENMHVNFLENKPNVAGKRHAWMFDLDYLTNSMNYKSVSVENQANKSASPKEANNSAGDKIEKNTGFKTYEKPVSQVEQVFLEEIEKLKRQEKEANDAAESLRKEATHDIQNASTSSTNLINTVSTPLSIAAPSRAFNDGELSYPDDPLMPHLKIIYASLSEGIFIDSSYDDECMVTDFNNLETTMSVSPTPTTRRHTIHSKTQILRDPKSVIQTRSKVNKNSEAHALKAIRTKWVYRNKKDEKGLVVRNKARLVAHGHRQEEGIDYDDVFAPVARIEAIRIFLAFASYMGFIVYQIDVKSAFMYGTINKEVYVSQPPGFVDPKFPTKIYNVVKALYDLHQAPKAWYATLSTSLEQSRYRRGAIDKTLFIKHDKKDIMLVQVYVDDIIFGSTKKSWCDEFEELIKNRFQMSSMGKLTFILGLQVKQKEDGIFISQDKYVAEILKKFDFLSVKTASTLIETQKPLVKDKEAADVDVTPKTSHLQAVKRIFRDAYEMKLVQVLKIHTDDNIADLLTKAFDVSSKELASPKQTALGKDISNLLMVVKPTESEGFEQIIDFLNGSSVSYAPTTRITTRTSCIKQFWTTTKVKTINDEVRIQALIDEKRYYGINNHLSCYKSEVQLLKLGDMSDHKDIYDNPSLKKKVFANIKRVGTSFSRVVTSLFDTMLLLAAQEQTQAPKVPSPEPSPENKLPFPSNDLLPGGEDSLKLKELFDLCTYLSNKVLEIESEAIDIKSTYKDTIEKLEGKVNRLEEENMNLKDLHSVHSKVDTAEPVVKKEKSFKQGRIIEDIDEDVKINLEEALG
nr:putative ribonuclease H-like domain-containing protein [Tanacetum cinerariifolium]